MLDKSIRKISIGSDVNNQLHISMNSFIGGGHVNCIKKIAPSTYEVWIADKDSPDSLRLWKEFENMPVVIEYNTRLD